MSEVIQSTTRPGSNRLAGLDALRAIAIIGMIYMHVSPTGWWQALPFADRLPVLAWFEGMITGRAMSLFVLLAGVSAALMTGGNKPHDGARLRSDRQRLAARAAVLFLISLLIDQLAGANLSILEYYTVWLLLLIPVLRLRPGTLLGLAGVLAVLLPLLCFLIMNFFRDWPISPFSGGGQATVGLALLWHPLDWPLKLKALLFGGGFQTPYALPLLLTGLALGRLDLRSGRLRTRLAVSGTCLVLGAWLVSGLALGPLGGATALEAAMTASGPMQQPWLSLLMLPPHQLYALSIPMAPFMLGVGLLLFCGLSALLERRLWQRLLLPLTDSGRLALTWYASHLVFMERVAGEPPYAFVLFAGIMLFAFTFSPLWLARFRRGPLEWLLGMAAAKLLPRGVGAMLRARPD